MSFSPADLQLIAPIVIVFVFAVLAMVLPFAGLIGHRRDASGQLAFALIGLATATVANALLAANVDGGHPAFSGMVRIDEFGVFVHFAVLAAAMGALLLGHEYLRRIDVQVPEYYALVLFASMGMMLMAIAADLIMLFVALEVMSISIYVLVAINRGEWKGVEGGFKYLILGAFSSAILLYGIAFIYGAVGSTRLVAIGEHVAEVGGVTADPVLALGLALALVGFGFKVAAAPFHMWSPDVYQGAPVPITAFMATGVKAAAFAAFARFLFVAFVDGRLDWGPALVVLAGLTILTGNVAALVQTDLKRMLAYSSIGHAGYLMMALAAVQPGGQPVNERIAGLLFYLAAYLFMTVGAFAALSMLTRDGADDTRLDRLDGLASRHPLIAAALSVCLLSLAGIPPTMGFVGKFYLFSAAVDGGLVGLAVVAAIGGGIGVYYYLRPIVGMYMKPVGEEPPPEYGGLAALTLGIATLAILLFGLFPGAVADLARAGVLSLFPGA